MKKKAFALLLAALLLAGLVGCGSGEQKSGLGNGMEPEPRMTLRYATQFSVDCYSGGYRLVTMADGSRFFIVPAESEVPKGVADDIVVLRQPVHNIYLAATSAMRS